jgi:PAS domain S-box-containing protein
MGCHTKLEADPRSLEPGSVVLDAARETQPAPSSQERVTALLRSVFDGAPDAIVVVDAERRVRYANRACVTLFGDGCQTLLGRRVSESLRVVEPTNPTRDGMLCGCAEVELPNGDRRWVAYSASPMRLPEAGSGFVLFLRDETERRRDQQRLSRRTDELEQTLRSLAHDLRSPLVSVLGFSRLLHEEFGELLGDRGLHLLDRITAGARSMESLIRDLLEFARLGHEDVQRTLVDPRQVLLQLSGELKPRLEKADVELRIPSEPPLLRCDRTRLYQLFSNLLGNALDHMGPCDAPRIEVEVHERSEWHEVLVRDNGRGIPLSEQQRIFEIFYSVPYPGGRKGTGIGLAIVKKIAELHGGRVSVESAPGSGATFRLLLPRD